MRPGALSGSGCERPPPSPEARCHGVVTLLFWLPLFLAGTLYNAVRWHDERGGVVAHPRGVALGEAGVPLLALALIGWGIAARSPRMYLLGVVPIALGAVAWWRHAAAMGCAPLPWGVPLALYGLLTCVVLAS